MPRHYQKKTDRGTFSKDVVMQAAVNMVLSGASVRNAAQKFDLNYKTSGRYVKLHKEKGTIDGVSFG